MSATSGSAPMSAPSGPTASGSAPAGQAAFTSAFPTAGSTVPQQPAAPAASAPPAGGSPGANAAAPSSSATYSAAAGSGLGDYFPEAPSQGADTGAAAGAQTGGWPTASSSPTLAANSSDVAPGESFGGWMLAVLLSGLPLIGLIYLCVVSFGGSASASRRNWARAVLVWQIIAIVLAVTFGVVISVLGYQLVMG